MRGTPCNRPASASTARPTTRSSPPGCGRSAPSPYRPAANWSSPSRRDGQLQLVQHLLEPQLLGLVDDDEQHLVMQARQRLLRRQQRVELQIVGIGHAGRRRGHARGLRANRRSDAIAATAPGCWLAARKARLADRADIAEQLLEEAALAAERRRLVARRIDRGDQVSSGLLDRRRRCRPGRSGRGARSGRVTRGRRKASGLGVARRHNTSRSALNWPMKVGRPSVLATESLLSTPTWIADASSLSMTWPRCSRDSRTAREQGRARQRRRAILTTDFMPNFSCNARSRANRDAHDLRHDGRGLNMRADRRGASLADQEELLCCATCSPD